MNNNIIVVGDNHFSDSSEWKKGYTMAAVQWFHDHPENKKGNTFIFLGDITDEFLASGWVYSQLLILFNGMEADCIIVHGNHTLKKRRGRYISTISFLEQLPNVEIIYTPKVKTINGHKMGFLPYFKDPINGLTMKEYYEGPILEEQPEFNTKMDYLFGHISDGSEGELFGEGIKIAVKYQNICLGHIHKPGGHYLGSFIPNNKGESGEQRYVLQISGTAQKVKIPEFIRYEEVDYPQPLPTTDAMFVAYTFKGVSDEEVVRKKYGNVSIKEMIPKEVIDSYEVSSDEDIRDVSDLLDDAYKDLKIPAETQSWVNQAFKREAS
jgi:predicted phosphodiesterase